jgi:hypothetical protein
MISRSAVVFGFLASLTASGPLWAKGDMVLIEVKGETLSAPIRITDPKVEDFTPWAGPGVNGARVPDAEGFIANWHAGIVTPRARGPQRYEVSFYAGCRADRPHGLGSVTMPPNDPGCLAEKPRLIYAVFYDYDPSSRRGFVYLPGKGERLYYLDMGTIARGIEGNWFSATSSWEDFIGPILTRALNRSH